MSKQPVHVLSLVALVSIFGSGAARAQDEIFVTNENNNSVTVYARTANGNVAPLRTIVGPATGLELPHGVAVDLVNDELFVANKSTGGGGEIFVFARTANGNAAPLRVIGGPLTQLDNPRGLSLDLVNNEVAVTGGDFKGGVGRVTVYSRTANGNVAPLRLLTGLAVSGEPWGVALDPVNNEMVVTNGSSILVFARTANGNVAPLRTIFGPTTGLGNATGLGVDLVNNEIAVANEVSVLVFARTANGDVAPLRTISGPATGLEVATGLAVDPVNNELAVSNQFTNALRVFSRTANGDVAPLRIITGAATGLNGPIFLAISLGGVPPTTGTPTNTETPTVTPTPTPTITETPPLTPGGPTNTPTLTATTTSTPTATVTIAGGGPGGPTAPIPTLSPLTMVILALALAGIGYLVLRAKA